MEMIDAILDDAVLLARIQFAFTISFHILFPAFTIGLASYLAVLKVMWLRTRRRVYDAAFWRRHVVLFVLDAVMHRAQKPVDHWRRIVFAAGRGRHVAVAVHAGKVIVAAS